jgi:nitrogen fixation protein FixH
MSLAETRPTGFTLKGWHVLVAILLFFGADIAVNAVFMITAYRTFPGETSVTPYEDGLAYNAAIKQMKDQQALGWRIAAGVNDAGHVQVQALDKAGAPLRGLKASGELLRPATETGRRSVTLRETAPGVYVASAGALTGAWDLDLTLVDAQGHKAVAERRLVLQ